MPRRGPTTVCGSQHRLSARKGNILIKVLWLLVLCGWLPMVGCGCKCERCSGIGEKSSAKDTSGSAGSASFSSDSLGGTPTGSSETPLPEKKPASGLRPDQVRLRHVDKAGFDAWLRSQGGKVVLVDFWATWCTPCRELFPHTVELARRFGSKGLVVVSVSLDEPEEEGQVRQFLAQQGAEFENFLAKGPPEPFSAFEISGGAIPHLKIYGADGKLFRQIGSDQQMVSPAAIDKAVEEALSKLLP